MINLGKPINYMFFKVFFSSFFMLSSASHELRCLLMLEVFSGRFSRMQCTIQCTSKVEAERNASGKQEGSRKEVSECALSRGLREMIAKS